MAQTGFTPILTYASNTPSSVPSAGNLTNSANGSELAVNTADKRLFTKDSGGSVVELGTNPSALTVAGNVTLSGGTANGVLYLNGSKVATSGSALTFDGTNLSVGGSNSQQRLNVVVPVFTTNASGGMRIGDSGNNYFVDQLVTTDGSANPFWDVKFASHTLSRYAYGGGNNFWAWYANNSEQMRLTSTGLGIGTSSPGAKLEVLQSQNGATRIRVNNQNTGASAVAGIDIQAYGGGWTIDVPQSATFVNPLQFIFGGSEKMTLDSSGNLGIGTSSPGAKLDVSGAASGSTIVSKITNTSGTANSQAVLSLDTSASGFNVRDAQIRAINNGSNQVSMAFYTANAAAPAEAMRIDNVGNLGVGTSSPTQKLDVVGNANVSGFIAINNAGGGIYDNLQQNVFYQTPNGTAFIWRDGASGYAERMRLDSSGNLGLGVTPSASWSGQNAFQIGGASLSYGSGVGLANNAVFTSSGFAANYLATGASALYLQGAGTHSWFTAPSGTAGNAISFTQAMTLDASGNLGVGTTSPNARLEIVEYNNSESGNSAAIIIKSDHGLGEDGAISKLIFAGANRPNGFAKISASGSDYNGGNGNMRFYTATGGALTERARITSGGDFGIGTSSPASLLDVATSGAVTATIRSTSTGGTRDAKLRLNVPSTGGDDPAGTVEFTYGTGYTVAGSIQMTHTNNNMKFFTGTTERARITSGGDLLVGTTSQVGTSLVSAYKNATGYMIGLNAGQASSGSTYYQIEFYSAGNAAGNITSTTSSVAYNTSSDYRLKDNPQPLTGSGAFIDALQPKTWEWKADGSKGVGFIAHEVQEVSPGSVVGEKDAVDADGKPVMQAMEYGSAEFIANIIAELQSLRARVAALEAA